MPLAAGPGFLHGHGCQNDRSSMARSVVDAEILEQLLHHLANGHLIGNANPHFGGPLSDEERIVPPDHIIGASGFPSRAYP